MSGCASETATGVGRIPGEAKSDEGVAPALVNLHIDAIAEWSSPGCFVVLQRVARRLLTAVPQYAVNTFATLHRLRLVGCVPTQARPSRGTNADVDLNIEPYVYMSSNHMYICKECGCRLSVDPTFVAAARPDP